MPTTDELLDLDVSMRRESMRFDLLDQSHAIIGALHPLDESATIDLDTGRAIIRTLRGVLLPPDEQADIDTIGDRVRPWWVLENGVEFPLGIYLFADANRIIRTTGTELEATLLDYNYILDQELSAAVSYDVGKNIGTALTELAEAAGVISHLIEGTARFVNAPVAWAHDARRLAAMSELCAMAGFSRPYFDNAGTLICETSPDVALAEPDHTYGPGGRIVVDTLLESDNLLRAPNRYIAIDTSAGDVPIVGGYDIDASAPHSFANRGFWVTSTLDLQGLQDTVAAEAAAEAAAFADTDTYRWVTFVGTPDPRHDTFDIVEYEGENYKELGWSLALQAGGAHTHDIRRVYP